MNTELVKQVLETVKTINLNVNSDTGKEALIGVVTQLKPVIVLMVLQPFILTGLGLITTIICVIAIGKTMERILIKKEE